MSSNKVIAKNTFFLYVRMFLTMGVGLYTSRIVLKALGVEDYGIYGVVGGIVTMFAFLNSAMSSATQRYLSFDIGKDDTLRLQRTFNASLNIHFLIALIIIILAETLGLWFVNTKLNMPADRMSAANWVYQFSIFTFALDIIQVPYNALLIARERMGIYAYISIAEAALKLTIAIIIVNSNMDRLILYGALIFVAAYITRMSYKLYCKKNFVEAKYKFYYDKEYYRELLSYSGWNLFGNIANVARNQGSNILLNIFFGPIANAAYTLTLTVQSAIRQFVSNFQVAANPQITKDYARGNIGASQNLMFKSAKFSYFMMLILTTPFLCNINYTVHLWLGTTPKYTIVFMKFALIYSLIETISNPLMVMAQATGKIKRYQIVIGSFIFMSFPVTWLVFHFVKEPVYLYWVLIGNSVISLLLRAFFLKSMIGMSLKRFFNDVVSRILITSAFTLLVITLCLPKFVATSIVSLILQSILFGFITLFGIFLFGIDKGERRIITKFIKNIINRNFDKNER